MKSNGLNIEKTGKPAINGKKKINKDEYITEEEFLLGVKARLTELYKTHDLL